MDSDSEDTSGAITLIGSVHLSEKYFEHIRETILDEDPDIVAIEIDPQRLRGLFTESGSTLSLSNVFGETSIRATALYMMLSYTQERMAKSLGLDPGMNDLRVAAESAAETETRLALIDRDINTTLERVSSQLTPSSITRVWLRSRKLDDEDFPVDSVRDLLDDVDNSEVFVEYREFLEEVVPEFIEPFLHERDRIMARRLYELEQDGHDIVAVVGGAHEAGVRSELEKLREMEPEAAAEEGLSSPIVRPVLETEG